MSDEHNKKGRYGLVIGIISSFVYMFAVVAAPFIFLEPLDVSTEQVFRFSLKEIPDTANKWGDYLAGLIAPLAVIWLIYTLKLQRDELMEQRKLLTLQQKTRESSQKTLESVRKVHEGTQ